MRLVLYGQGPDSQTTGRQRALIFTVQQNVEFFRIVFGMCALVVHFPSRTDLGMIDDLQKLTQAAAGALGAN